MRKKGELTMETVIALILLLIVLIVVALIFRQQIIDFVTNIQGTSSTLGSNIKDATSQLKK